MSPLSPRIRCSTLKVVDTTLMMILYEAAGEGYTLLKPMTYMHLQPN